MILYATLALCAAVTGVVVYRYDLYDRPLTESTMWLQ